MARINSKTKNVQQPQLQIRLNNSAIFLPGSILSGTIVLSLTNAAKQFRAKHLFFWAGGRAKTQKMSFGINAGADVLTDRPEMCPQVQNIQLLAINKLTTAVFPEIVVIWQELNGIDEFEAGKEHEFQFSFPLPQKLAPTFEGTFASIKYKCKAKFETKTHGILKCATEFAIQPLPLSNAQMRELSSNYPQQRPFSKTFGVLFNKQVVSGEMRLLYSILELRAGSRPIGVEIKINNGTKKRIVRLDIALLQLITAVGPSNPDTIKKAIFGGAVIAYNGALTIASGGNPTLPALAMRVPSALFNATKDLIVRKMERKPVAQFSFAMDLKAGSSAECRHNFHTAVYNTVPTCLGWPPNVRVEHEIGVRFIFEEGNFWEKTNIAHCTLPLIVTSSGEQIGLQPQLYPASSSSNSSTNGLCFQPAEYNLIPSSSQQFSLSTSSSFINSEQTQQQQNGGVIGWNIQL